MYLCFPYDSGLRKKLNYDFPNVLSEVIEEKLIWPVFPGKIEVKSMF